MCDMIITHSLKLMTTITYSAIFLVGLNEIRVSSPSLLDSDVTWFPVQRQINSSLMCPAACSCAVVHSSTGSARRMAACDRPIQKNDPFDPETEIVHVTGNCHRSFLSIMTSVGTLPTPRELAYRRCHLYTLEQLMLAGDGVNWETVLVLDVGFNLITNITRRTFVKMPSLRTLILTHNRIEKIEEDAFDGLNFLARVDLSGNRLSMITRTDMRWLCALRSLDELSLRDNGVHVLAGMAVHCPATPCPLRHLDLGDNRIRRVEDDAFSGLPNITHLYLDASQLTTVPTVALVRLSAVLEELDMSENQLNALLTDSFRDLLVLRVLRLSRMRTLMFVDRKSFVNLTSLERVELSDNPALRYVDREAFVNTPNITNISMYGGGLDKVDRELVETLPSLKSLDVRLNPIGCDCQTQWMRQSNITVVNHDFWQLCNDDLDRTECPPQVAPLFGNNLDVQLTDSFTLYCRGIGFPPPEVGWLLPSSLDGNLLYPQVPVATVTVKTASSRDAGNYTCLATNVHGTDSRSVIVDVMIPPVVLSISRLTSTSVTLVWKHVEHYQSLRLTHWTLTRSHNESVDREISSSTPWIDVQYYMRSYTVAELRPDTLYRFCISVLPNPGGYDVISGSTDDDWSLWTVDCVDTATLVARDYNVASDDVRRYVISGCTLAVAATALVCIVVGRRRCGRGVEWPAEVSDGGSSGRLSPTIYADSSADCDDADGGGSAGWNAFKDEIYENVGATSLVSIFNAADLDEIRRTAVLSCSWQEDDYAAS